jgi:cytoskeletal protein CcmA (bactofilin family)
MSIFGNKEKEENQSEEKFNFQLASEDIINQSTLAKDTQIHGSIEAKDYINFDGSITGTIKSKTVNLGRTSYVKGTVTADQITIEGEVDGDIQGKDVYIKSSAKIKGTIRYSNIDIQDGSIINADLSYS